MRNRLPLCVAPGALLFALSPAGLPPIVTAEKVGMETTTYARNIYKYYAAYKLMRDIGQQRKQAREQAAR